MEPDIQKELKDLQVTIDQKFEEVKEGITSHEDIKSEIGLKVEELETALQVDGKPIIEYVKEMQKSHWLKAWRKIKRRCLLADRARTTMSSLN